MYFKINITVMLTLQYNLDFTVTRKNYIFYYYYQILFCLNNLLDYI